MRTRCGENEDQSSAETTIFDAVDETKGEEYEEQI